MLRHDGVAAAWGRYWATLFSVRAEPEVIAAARKLALEQDVDDLIPGVRAFHDRRDHSEFVKTWCGQLLVVSGAGDRTPTPAAAVSGVEEAGARQMIIEYSGHYVPLEQPYVFDPVLRDQWRILHA